MFSRKFKFSNREGSFLGIPAVNIGNRQNGREHGKNLISVKDNKKSILKAIQIQIKRKKYKSEKFLETVNQQKK